jgi:hypothetical protein
VAEVKNLRSPHLSRASSQSTRPIRDISLLDLCEQWKRITSWLMNWTVKIPQARGSQKDHTNRASLVVAQMHSYQITFSAN